MYRPQISSRSAPGAYNDLLSSFVCDMERGLILTKGCDHTKFMQLVTVFFLTPYDILRT